jgi:2-phospho-L-lactate guanylyltransferase
MLAMAEDVLAALTAAPGVERILLVSNEPEAGRLLSAWPLEVFYSSDNEGLNRELEHAAAYAASRGAERVLIVHADLPWLSPDALDRFIAGCPDGKVCAASCKLGTGTNALLVPLPLPLPLVFGADSLQGFRDAAAAAGLELQVAEDPHLALDVDNPDDFERLSGAPNAGQLPGPATRRALEQMVDHRAERIA